jgi:hypothetical protein
MQDGLARKSSSLSSGTLRAIRSFPSSKRLAQLPPSVGKLLRSLGSPLKNFCLNIRVVFSVGREILASVLSNIKASPAGIVRYRLN